MAEDEGAALSGDERWLFEAAVMLLPQGWLIDEPVRVPDGWSYHAGPRDTPTGVDTFGETSEIALARLVRELAKLPP
jgi:hypothetical protein